MLIIDAKLSILDVCGGPGYASGNSATGKNATYKKCKRRGKQNKNIATCKSATWNSMIHKKSATQKSATGNGAVRKVQHEKSTTWKMCIMKNLDCHGEIRKKCTRIVNSSA